MIDATLEEQNCFSCKFFQIIDPVEGFYYCQKRKLRHDLLNVDPYLFYGQCYESKNDVSEEFSDIVRMIGSQIKNATASAMNRSGIVYFFEGSPKFNSEKGVWMGRRCTVKDSSAPYLFIVPEAIRPNPDGSLVYMRGI